jgi:uncharacterized protein (UPF0303 family)
MTSPLSSDIPTFNRFDHDDAFRVGTRLATRCREQQLPVVISLHLGLQRVFHAALPGTSADNDSWVDRKIRTAQYFADSSLAVYHRFAKDGWEQFFFAFGLAPERYAPAGGAVPIWVAGAIVGVLGMSGLDAQEDDHELVLRALQDDYEEQAAAAVRPSSGSS